MIDGAGTTVDEDGAGLTSGADVMEDPVDSVGTGCTWVGVIEVDTSRVASTVALATLLTLSTLEVKYGTPFSST
jgi:hypothetical protein